MSKKSATPSYWKSNEEIAVLLMTRGCRTESSRKVLARIEARIETQSALRGK